MISYLLKYTSKKSSKSRFFSVKVGNKPMMQECLLHKLIITSILLSLIHEYNNQLPFENKGSRSFWRYLFLKVLLLPLACRSPKTTISSTHKIHQKGTLI